jgi:hypothetical protein
MDLDAVMDQIASRVDTIAGLRAFAFVPDKITPPSAVVAFPERVRFDETYKRGYDRVSLPIFVLVGRLTDRSARELLIAYCAGSGAKSIKAVVESGTYTAFDDLRVEGIDFNTYQAAGTEFVGAKFMLDIAGEGA